MVRRRRIRKAAQFRKAMWYLARGYPHAFVAKEVGVHRNCVMKWARRTTFGDVRVVNRLAKQIDRLSPDIARKLLERLVAQMEESEYQPIEQPQQAVM